MKQTLLLLFTLVALALSFFFLEEKKEDQSEISVWEIDIDEIEYQPPKNSWEGEDISAFYRMPIVLKKQKESEKTPIFSPFTLRIPKPEKP